MKRKVVRQGKSSLNVSIPNGWIKRHGLNKGDEIDIEEKDDTLVISSGKEKPPETKVLDVSDLDEKSIDWYMTSLYCSGYDELKVIFKDHEQINVIHERIRNLLGFNIMDQKKKYCIIRSISQPVEEEFEPSLRRIFMVMLSIADGTLEALKNKDTKAFNSVLTMEDTCSRITYFCLRLLNKKGFRSAANTTYLYNLINRLASISYAYGGMMRKIKEKKLNMDISSDVIEIFIDTNDLLRTFYKNFYKTESARIHEVAMEVDQTYDRIIERATEATATEQHILYFLNQVRSYIGESIVSVLGINIRNQK